MVASYTRMMAYGAHLRCDNADAGCHVTYDSGIGVTESECVPGAIDLGILRKIYLVAFGSLNVIVLKVSWIQHMHQGRPTIKKDVAGFWTCRFDARDDDARRNPFLLPANASQVFFLDDSRDPEWRVVVFHEPRSKRVTGSDAHEQFHADRDEMNFETPCPSMMEDRCAELGAPLAVPLEQVRSPEAQIQMADDEAIFDDTEYEEDLQIGI